MVEIAVPDKPWKDAILEAVRRRGSRVVSLHDIYDAMEKHPLVTPYHREPWRADLQPRYQCWIRRYLTDLVREKKISRVSKGMYSLVRS